MRMGDTTHAEGVSLRQPVSEPLYDTRSEEEIFYELSERLGILEQWNERMNRMFGFHLKPELLLEKARKYTDKEIARRKACSGTAKTSTGTWSAATR